MPLLTLGQAVIVKVRLIVWCRRNSGAARRINECHRLGEAAALYGMRRSGC